MHLVFLNQYYPPDAAPTGVMLEGLVEGLVRDGHEVTVLCAAGGYAGGRVVRCPLSVVRDCDDELKRGAQAPQTTDNGQRTTLPLLHIHRIRATRFGRGTFLGKLLDYASFYVGVSWKLLTMRPAPERIVALTTPPYLSVLARLMSKLRGADHAHWVMDLYPDVLAAHGMMDERGLPYRLLAALARWGFGGKRCAAVLTLGPDMAERVEGRVGGCPLSVVRDCEDELKRSAQALEGQELSVVRCPLSVIAKMSASDERKLNRQQTTDHGQRTTVTWVPLWGAGEVVGCPLSVVRDCEDELGRGAQALEGEELSVVRCPLSVIAKLSGSDERKLNGQQTTDNGQRTTHPNPALAMRRARGWGDDDLVLMYSGNMGLGHRFGEIMAAAKELAAERVTSCSLSVKTQNCKTQDARKEVRRTNANVECRTEEAGGGRADRPRSANISPTGRDADAPPVSSDPPRDSPAAAKLPRPTDNGQQTTEPRLRLVFFGGGKRQDEVAAFAREHPECGIEMHDYAPADELVAHLQSADVHLASLDPAWTGTMVPSKVQGIFGAGRPVIFIGSAQSSIGRWVLESGGGWVVAADNVPDLLAALAEARDPTERAARGRAALAFAEKHFDQRTNVARVAAILTASASSLECG